MSNSCLVTKLKEVVENSTLPYLNAFKFFVGNATGEMNFTCTGEPFTIETLDSSAKIATSKANADNDIFVSKVTVNGTNHESRFWVKNPNCEFLVREANNVKRFLGANWIGGQLSIVPLTIDTNDIKFCSDMQLLLYGGGIIKGSIDNLYNLSINNINGVTGQFRFVTFVDDNDFNKFGNIKSMPANVNFDQGLRDTNLVGSIEGFVANYRKTHPSTVAGSLSFAYMYTGESTTITFNGDKINVGERKNWTWAANELDSTHTDITNPSGSITITIDADGNKV